MDSPFMQAFASGLGKCGIRVVRFEFPYMEKSRQDGKRRPPDRETVLRETWLEVIDQLHDRPLVIAGKSDMRLKHIEFVRLEATKALVVLVGEDGNVENRILELPLPSG